MKFYHATPRETMQQIRKEGRIRRSAEGAVFLCKNPADSCKFLIVRGIKEVSVIEVDVDEGEVIESHDHSEEFFGCKAYMHMGDIELSGNENVYLCVFGI